MTDAVWLVGGPSHDDRSNLRHSIRSIARNMPCVDKMWVIGDSPAWLSAAGQGAIAIQIRRDDTAMRELFAPLADQRTMADVAAERAFLATLEGGCQVPIGAAVIPVLAMVMLLAGSTALLALVAIAERPAARLRDALRACLYLVVRRWYLTLFSLAVLALFEALLAAHPAPGAIDRAALGVAVGERAGLLAFPLGLQGLQGLLGRLRAAFVFRVRLAAARAAVSRCVLAHGVPAARPGTPTRAPSARARRTSRRSSSTRARTRSRP